MDSTWTGEGEGQDLNSKGQHCEGGWFRGGIISSLVCTSTVNYFSAHTYSLLFCMHHLNCYSLPLFLSLSASVPPSAPSFPSSHPLPCPCVLLLHHYPLHLSLSLYLLTSLPSLNFPPPPSFSPSHTHSLLPTPIPPSLFPTNTH